MRTAYRRRGRSTTRRWRRTTIGPSALYQRARAGRHRSDRAAARAVPYPPVPHSAGMAEIVEQLRAQGLHPSPLPLGLLRPGEEDGCILCNTCNSFACKLHAKSEAEVVLRAPGAAAAERHAVDERPRRRLLTDPSGGRVEARRGRARRRDGARRARRWSSCRAAPSTPPRCCCGRKRRASARAGELVRPGRPALHGAPCDDDAGLPSVPAELDRVPEDGGDQRLLPARRRHAVPARTDSVAGADSRRHGADRGIRGFRCGPTSHGSRAASTGWRCRRICPRSTTVSPSSADGRIRLRYRPNNVKPHQHAGRRNEAHPAPARLLDRDDAFARQHATRRTSAGRCASAPIHATSVLDPYCRTHDVENLFVVDASFFPSSAAVNPGLTIAAQAIRVADHIKATELRSDGRPPS